MADWAGAFSNAMKAGSGLIDMEIQKQNQIEAEQRAADTRASLEERMSAIREAADARAAERREQIRQSGRKADFEFETNPENIKAKAQAEVTAMETTAPVKARLKREETLAEATPEMLAAKRKIAQAGHIESASSIASANLSKFQLEQLQEAANLEKEYRAAVDAGDEEKASKAARKLAGAKVDKKDAGDYLRAATNTLRLVEKAATPEEAVDLKEMADLMFRLAGVDPAKAAAAGKPSSGAPYADGTRLKDKDGLIYVVRNGKPVPEAGSGGAGGGLINMKP